MIQMSQTPREEGLINPNERIDKQMNQYKRPSTKPKSKMSVVKTVLHSIKSRWF